MRALNLPTYDAKVTIKDGKRFIFDPLRARYVALTPEEWVRQHFVHFLLTEKRYPQNLLGNEVSIRLNTTLKRCDTVVYDRFLSPLAIIEYKAPSVQITQAVFEQIVRYNMALQVKYLLVSNGLSHYCCRIDYAAQTYAYLPDIPAYDEL